MVPACWFVDQVVDSRGAQGLVDCSAAEIVSTFARLPVTSRLIILEQWMFVWLRRIARGLATPVVPQPQQVS